MKTVKFTNEVKIKGETGWEPCGDEYSTLRAAKDHVAAFEPTFKEQGNKHRTIRITTTTTTKREIVK